METINFTLIKTKSKECRMNFYIKDNLMFIHSNFDTKNLITAGFNESWLAIIKDRGNWQYFHRKIMLNDYENGNPFSEMEKECFEQLIEKVKNN